MKIGVLLLNFGEPEEPTMQTVVPFLERIFAANAGLMGSAAPTEAEIRERSHRLALDRGPGLIEAYEQIGGSPLHRQAREQAEALEALLGRRGHDAVVLLGMQFTDPPISEAVSAARAAGVDFLVSIPVYPLCGPSTTVAALAEVDRELAAQGWSVRSRQVSGWHRHPAYLRIRTAAISTVLTNHALDLSDPGTRLIFSAHGTPLRYLEDGSRYVEYVETFCASVAAELKAPSYLLGYQNHTNRPGVRWTEPGIEDVIEKVEAKRVVVDAVSFMHEQSETLAELDDELRETAEARDLAFYRVPIPHLDSAFIGLLADLVEGSLDTGSASSLVLSPCRCKPTSGTFCTNSRS